MDHNQATVLEPLTKFQRFNAQTLLWGFPPLLYIFPAHSLPLNRHHHCFSQAIPCFFFCYFAAFRLSFLIYILLLLGGDYSQQQDFAARIIIMFKSILKGPQKGPASKGTQPKVVLRVSFSLDEQSTQQEQHSTQVMSWTMNVPEAEPTQQLQQANEKAGAKSGDSLIGGDEFKPENIKWNGFVLVYNTKCTLPAFHCGKCQKTFLRVTDFAFHCLAECNEISHIDSSHFIFDEEDWQRFVNKQRSKALQQQQQPSLNNDPKKDDFQSRMKAVQDFTKNTLDFWRDTAMAETFVPEQHYIYECGLIMLLNPILEDYASTQFYTGKKKCPLYKPKASREEREMIVNQHFNEKCCPIYTPDATYLLLDADLFYGYIFEKGKGLEEIDPDNMDLPYLLYLYDHTHLKTQIQAKYPQIVPLRPYIELFFKIPSMIPQSNHLQPWIKRKRAYFSEYSNATFDIYFRKKKTFCLTFYGQYLKDRTINCPCQQFSTPMTIQQFTTHLRKEGRHEIRIAQHLFPSD